MAATDIDVFCGSCEKIIVIEVEKHVFCKGSCKKFYHRKCGTVSEIEYKKYQKDKHKVWFCEKCVDDRTEIITERRLSTQGVFSRTSKTTPVPETTNTTIKETAIFHSVPLDVDVTDISNMKSFMNEIHSIVKEIRLQQIDMRTAINDLKTSTDGMDKKMEAIVKANEELKKENTELRKHLENCNFRINNFEQGLLTNNVEICGIPEERNESINDILNDVNNSVDGNLGDDDVICFYRKFDRKNKAGLPRPIIVQFNNISTKLAFMKKCKSKGKQFNTSIVSNVKPARPIYINHQLTRATSYLYMNAKKEIKNDKFKFVWIQNGKVLTRRADHGPVQEIYNINHLNDIVNKH